MKTIKIVSTAKNGHSAEIPATSANIAGQIRSLKKDGNFIKGRYPMKEEESLLWNYLLTTKEKIDKHNTVLYSLLHVPEEGIDDITTDAAIRMINLYTHLKESQYVFWWEEVEENGQMVRKQGNKHYRRNYLLSFEMIDITAQEEKAFKNERMITRFRGLIDEIYDKDETGKGVFLDLCYGMNVSQCYKNAKRHNYNLLVDKLKISPMSFDRYWSDDEKDIVVVINKGKKLPSDDKGTPYITSDENGVCFYKQQVLGKTDQELKLFFKAHPEELEYLMREVGVEAKPIAKEPEIRLEVTKTEKDYTHLIEHDLTTTSKQENFNLGSINRETSLIVGLYKKAQDKHNQKGMENMINRIKDGRKKFHKNLDYFNNKLAKTAAEKGVEIPEELTVEA